MLKHGQRHETAAATKIEQAIAHARMRDKLALVDREHGLQPIRVDEIKAMAARHIADRRITEQTGNGSFFAIEIADVSDRAALLQHLRAAGDIANPAARLPGP